MGVFPLFLINTLCINTQISHANYWLIRIKCKTVSKSVRKKSAIVYYKIAAKEAKPPTLLHQGEKGQKGK